MLHILYLFIFLSIFLRQFEPPVSTEPNIEQTYLADRGHLPKPFISDKCYDDGRLLPEHVIESDGSVTLTDKGRLQVSACFDIKKRYISLSLSKQLSLLLLFSLSFRYQTLSLSLSLLLLSVSLSLSH